MKYFSQIFTDTMRLYVGTNSECFCEYRDYFHVRSIFSSEWYNFIVPKLSNPADLDTKELNKLIKSEKDDGKKVSFYINQTLLNSYQSYLKKNDYRLGGNEIYLQKTLHNIDKPKLPADYVVDSSYDLNAVVSVLEKCFPEWPEEKAYLERYEQYKKIGQEDRCFETFVVHHQDEIVGSGSISLDKNLNLGYLHNAGILATHRRKGLHTALVDERCLYCIVNGVTRVVSIVDDNAGSYTSLLNNGFVTADKFYLFVKSS